MSLSGVFGMHACSLFRFVLIKLRHRREPSACIEQLNIPVLNLVLCLVVYICFAFYCISVLS